MEYLVNMMPKNMQTLLAIESDMKGVNPLNLLHTAVQGSSESSVSFDVAPLTGKAANREGGSTDTGFGELDMDKIHVYLAMELYLDFINIFLRLLSLTGKRK
jgi:hypothetical protein